MLTTRASRPKVGMDLHRRYSGRSMVALSQRKAPLVESWSPAAVVFPRAGEGGQHGDGARGCAAVVAALHAVVEADDGGRVVA